MIPRMASRSVRSGNARSGAAAVELGQGRVTGRHSDCLRCDASGTSHVLRRIADHRRQLGLRRKPMRGSQKRVSGAQRIGSDAAAIDVVVTESAEIEERIDARSA